MLSAQKSSRNRSMLLDNSLISVGSSRANFQNMANRHNSKLSQIYQLYASNPNLSGNQCRNNNRNASEAYTEVKDSRERLPSYLPYDG